MTENPSRRNLKILVRQLIDRCTLDEAFKKEFIRDPKKIFQEHLISFPIQIEYRILENTKDLYHLIVPREPLSEDHQIHTLTKSANFSEVCRFIMTHIQEGDYFSKRLLSQPLLVLHEQGVDIPSHLKLKIHLNTDKVRYLVIPRQMEQDEVLSDFELQTVAGYQSAPIEL